MDTLYDSYEDRWITSLSVAPISTILLTSSRDLYAGDL